MSENTTLQPNIKLPHPDRQVDNLHHLERIAEAMKPDPREYEYTGIVRDLQSMTGHCACGHSIRYEFVVAHKTTGSEVVIGSVCIDTSIPWLIANGADRLAEQLKNALEANEEAKKEAMRELRDARNSEEVLVLEDFYASLKDWHKQAREDYKAMNKGSYWLPEFLYRGLPQVKAMSTPGRTASSLRTKITTLAMAAFETGIDFPLLPDDKKLREKMTKALKERVDRMNRDLERYKKYSYYADSLEKLSKELPEFITRAEDYSKRNGLNG